MNKILGKILILLLIPSASFAVDILVSTDRDPVTINESFQLTFEAKGSVDDDPDFSALSPLLDIIRQGSNSNISIINGTMSRSKTWNLTVMAKQTGQLQIPSIAFGDDRSPPILINVSKQKQSASTNENFFIRLKSDAAVPIQNAQIVITVQVFSNRSLSEFSLQPLQFSHSNVLVEPLGDETNYQTQLGGKPYLVIEQKVALFPQQAGPLSVSPVVAEGAIKQGNQSFFNRAPRRVVRAQSDPMHFDIQVKLKGKKYWLPAQNLQIQQQWSDDINNFTVGEPITRTITLKATALTAAQLPDLVIKNGNEFKLYPDQAELHNDIKNTGITAFRQQKIAYIPNRKGLLKIPAIEIPWWNTTTEQWHVAKLEAQTIQVKANPSSQQTNAFSNPINTLKDSEPKTQPAEVVTVIKETEPWWKWLALLFGLLWIITSLYLIRAKIKTTQIINNNAPNKAPKFDKKALKKACQSSNISSTKEQLLNWARHHYYPQTFNNLAQLESILSLELYSEIQQLQQQIYSKSKSQWDGNKLYELINTHVVISKEDSKDLKGLSSLHPQRSSD